MKKRNKKKIGRNDPCPCGSGVKYKKCHYLFPEIPVGPLSEKIEMMKKSHEANESRRQSQQGKGKPIISTEHEGYRLTAVGNQFHYSKTHKTFIDFLGDYIRGMLGHEWGNSEIAKPLKDRHQILQWYDEICALQKEYMKKPEGEIQVLPVTGLVAAYYGLAYNLYLLQHNAILQEYLIQRLKRSESFYAAYYETYVAAWFILSGFELRLEDEQDSSRTHPEFIAMRNGENYSVEAKTRQPDKDHFDVGNQLYDALRIESQYSRVIFIDMNVSSDVDFEAFRDKALNAILSREKTLTINGNPAPPAHVFVTNQPYHLAENETHLPLACLTVGFKIHDFGHGVKFTSYTEAYKARTKYSALNDVQNSVITYKIPATFDGEIPEIAFGKAERRFIIGKRLEVAEGVYMTLKSGIVSEATQKAYLVLNNDAGQDHIVSFKLSDIEMATYKSHPETFFGSVIPVSRDANNPMDFFTFLVDSYKETSREKLLELMNTAPDIKELEKLPQDELLFAYAERMTYQIVADRQK